MLNRVQRCLPGCSLAQKGGLSSLVTYKAVRLQPLLITASLGQLQMTALREAGVLGELVDVGHVPSDGEDHLFQLDRIT